MYDRLFQNNANLPENNRFTGFMGHEVQSPANSLFLSPFPSVWTPSIFLVDGPQAESPRIGFSDFEAVKYS